MVCFPAGTDSLVIAAPAKVNLFLEVLGKRPDGFHQVETLILAVDLFDTLEIRSDAFGEIQLHCEAPGVPSGPTNLAYRAAEAFQRAVHETRGAAIRLTKRIPSEAGLGGGSSDAAAVIAGLNRLWNRDMSCESLQNVAAKIGSDVGFFLTPPAGWCTGRGEEVEPERVERPLDLVIVKPSVGLSTAAVYRRVTVPRTPMSGETAREALRMGDSEAVARSLHNRLQEAAFAVEPEVEKTYRHLEACQPLGCLLSGSGSSVFAICQNRTDAIRVAERFRSTDGGEDSKNQVFVVRSYCS